MHDVLDLERRGVVGGFVATSVFREAAAAQGASLGYEPCAVFVDHPVQDRTDEEMRALADAWFEAVLALVVDPAVEPDG